MDKRNEKEGGLRTNKWKTNIKQNRLFEQQFTGKAVVVVGGGGDGRDG